MPLKRIFLSFLVLISITGYSQETLNGLVINQDGDELIGATIIRNANGLCIEGTQTDLDGSFSLTLDKTDTIKISYLGYKDKLLPFEELSFDNLVILERTGYDLAVAVITAYSELRISKQLSCTYILPVPQYPKISLDIQIQGEKWKLYPNPTSGNLTIESEYTKVGSIELVDINGKLLQRYPAEKRKEYLNLDQYPAGVYYLRHLIDDKSRFIGKVIKVD